MMEVTSCVEEQDGGTVVKRLSVPVGLEELMTGLTREVLQKKPRDIYSFAADHFAQLLALRDNGNYQQAPSKSITYASRESVENLLASGKIQPTKSSNGTPTKLSRQVSIRAASPTRHNGPKIKRSSTPKHESNNNHEGKIKDKQDKKKPVPNKRQSSGSKGKFDNLEPVKEDALKMLTKRQSLSRRSTDKKSQTDSENSKDSKRSSSEESEKRKRPSRDASLKKKSTQKKVQSGDSKELKDKKNGQEKLKGGKEETKKSSFEDATKAEKVQETPTLGLQHSGEIHDVIIPKETTEDSFKDQSMDQNEDVRNEHPDKFILKSPSIEESTTGIQDGRLTVTPPKILKEVQTSSDDFDLSTTLIVPVLTAVTAGLNDQKSPDQSTSTTEQGDESKTEGDSETGEIVSSLNDEDDNKDASSKTYDPSALREELQKVDQENKLNSFTSSYNPYKLKQEIRNASKENAGEEEGSSAQSSADSEGLGEISKTSDGDKESAANNISKGMEPDVTEENGIEEAHVKENSQEKGKEEARQKLNVPGQPENNKLQLLHEQTAVSEGSTTGSIEGSSLENKEMLAEDSVEENTFSTIPTANNEESPVVSSSTLGLQHSGELHDQVIPKDSDEDKNASKKNSKMEKPSKTPGATPIVLGSISGLQHSGEIHDQLIPKEGGLDKNVPAEEIELDAMLEVPKTESPVDFRATSGLQHSGELHDQLIPKEIHEDKSTSDLKNVAETEEPQGAPSFGLQHSGELHDPLIPKEISEEKVQKTPALGLRHSGELHDTLIPKQVNVEDENEKHQSLDLKEVGELQNEIPQTNLEVVEDNKELGNSLEGPSSVIVEKVKYLVDDAQNELKGCAVEKSKQESDENSAKLSMGETIAQAASKIQAGVRGYLTRKLNKNKTPGTPGTIPNKLSDEELQEALTQLDSIPVPSESPHTSRHKREATPADLIDIRMEDATGQKDKLSRSKTVHGVESEKSLMPNLFKSLSVTDSALSKTLDDDEKMRDSTEDSVSLEHTEDLGIESEKSAMLHSDTTIKNVEEEKISETSTASLEHSEDVAVIPKASETDREKLEGKIDLGGETETEKLEVPKNGKSVQEVEITAKQSVSHLTEEPTSVKEPHQLGSTAGLQHSGELHDILIPKKVEEASQKGDILEIGSLRHSGKSHDPSVQKEIEKSQQEFSQKEKDEKILEAESFQGKEEKRPESENLQHSAELHDIIIPKEASSEFEDAKTLVKDNLQHTGELHDLVVPTETEGISQDDKKFVKDILRHSGELHDLLIPKEVEETLQDVKDIKKLVTENIQASGTLSEEISQKFQDDKTTTKDALQHSGEQHDMLIPKEAETTAQELQDYDEAKENLQHSGELHDILTPKGVQETLQEAQNLKNLLTKGIEASGKLSEEITQNLQDDKILIKDALQRSNELHNVLISNEAEKTTQELQDDHEMEENLEHSGELHDLLTPKAVKETLQEAQDLATKSIQARHQFSEKISQELQEDKTLVKDVLQHSGELHDVLISQETEKLARGLQDDDAAKENLQHSGELHDLLIPKEVQETLQEANDLTTDGIQASGQLSKKISQELQEDKTLLKDALQHSGELHDVLIPKEAEYTAQKLEDVDEAKENLQHSGESHDFLIPKEVKETLQEAQDLTTDGIQASGQLSEKISQELQEDKTIIKDVLQHSGELHDLVIPTEAENTAQELQNDVVKENLQHSGELHDLLIPKQVEETLQKAKDVKNLAAEGIQAIGMLSEDISQDLQDDKTLIKDALQHSGVLHDVLIPKEADNTVCKLQGDEEAKESLQHSGELHDIQIPKEIEDVSQKLQDCGTLQKENDIQEKIENDVGVQKNQVPLISKSPLKDGAEGETTADDKSTEPSLNDQQEDETKKSIDEKANAADDVIGQSLSLKEQIGPNDSEDRTKHESGLNSLSGLQHSGELHDLLIPQNEVHSKPQVEEENVQVEEEIKPSSSSTTSAASRRDSPKLTSRGDFQHSGEMHDILIPQENLNVIDFKDQSFTDSPEIVVEDNQTAQESHKTEESPVGQCDVTTTSSDGHLSSLVLDEQASATTLEKDPHLQGTVGLQHTGELHDILIAEPTKKDFQDAGTKDDSKPLALNQVQNVDVAKVECSGNENSLNQPCTTSVLAESSELEDGEAVTTATPSFDLQQYALSTSSEIERKSPSLEHAQKEIAESADTSLATITEPLPHQLKADALIPENTQQTPTCTQELSASKATNTDKPSSNESGEDDKALFVKNNSQDGETRESGKDIKLQGAAIEDIQQVSNASKLHTELEEVGKQVEESKDTLLATAENNIAEDAVEVKKARLNEVERMSDKEPTQKEKDAKKNGEESVDDSSTIVLNNNVKEIEGQILQEAEIDNVSEERFRHHETCDPFKLNAELDAQRQTNDNKNEVAIIVNKDELDNEKAEAKIQEPGEKSKVQEVKEIKAEEGKSETDFQETSKKAENQEDERKVINEDVDAEEQTQEVTPITTEKETDENKVSGENVIEDINRSNKAFDISKLHAEVEEATKEETNVGTTIVDISQATNNKISQDVEKGTLPVETIIADPFQENQKDNLVEHRPLGDVNDLNKHLNISKLQTEIQEAAKQEYKDEAGDATKINSNKSPQEVQNMADKECAEVAEIVDAKDQKGDVPLEDVAQTEKSFDISKLVAELADAGNETEIDKTESIIIDDSDLLDKASSSDQMIDEKSKHIKEQSEDGNGNKENGLNALHASQKDDIREKNLQEDVSNESFDIAKLRLELEEAGNIREDKLELTKKGAEAGNAEGEKRRGGLTENEKIVQNANPSEGAVNPNKKFDISELRAELEAAEKDVDDSDTVGKEKVADDQSTDSEKMTLINTDDKETVECDIDQDFTLEEKPSEYVPGINTSFDISKLRAELEVAGKEQEDMNASKIANGHDAVGVQETVAEKHMQSLNSEPTDAEKKIVETNPQLEDEDEKKKDMVSEDAASIDIRRKPELGEAKIHQGDVKTDAETFNHAVEIGSSGVSNKEEEEDLRNIQNIQSEQVRKETEEIQSPSNEETTKETENIENETKTISEKEWLEGGTTFDISKLRSELKKGDILKEDETKAVKDNLQESKDTFLEEKSHDYISQPKTFEISKLHSELAEAGKQAEEDKSEPSTDTVLVSEIIQPDTKEGDEEQAPVNNDVEELAKPKSADHSKPITNIMDDRNKDENDKEQTPLNEGADESVAHTKLKTLIGSNESKQESKVDNKKLPLLNKGVKKSTKLEAADQPELETFIMYDKNKRNSKEDNEKANDKEPAPLNKSVEESAKLESAGHSGSKPLIMDDKNQQEPKEHNQKEDNKAQTHLNADVKESANRILAAHPESETLMTDDKNKQEYEQVNNEQAQLNEGVEESVKLESLDHPQSETFIVHDKNKQEFKEDNEKKENKEQTHLHEDVKESAQAEITKIFIMDDIDRQDNEELPPLNRMEESADYPEAKTRIMDNKNKQESKESNIKEAQNTSSEEKNQVINIPVSDLNSTVLARNNVLTPIQNADQNSQSSLPDESPANVYESAPTRPVTSDITPNINPNENIQIPSETLHKQVQDIEQIIKPDIESDENLALEVNNCNKDAVVEKIVEMKEVSKSKSAVKENNESKEEMKMEKSPNKEIVLSNKKLSEELLNIEETKGTNIESTASDDNKIKAEEDGERPISITSTTSTDSVATVITVSPQERNSNRKDSLSRSLSNSSEKSEDSKTDTQIEDKTSNLNASVPVNHQAKNEVNGKEEGNEKQERGGKEADTKDATEHIFDMSKLKAETEELAHQEAENETPQNLRIENVSTKNHEDENLSQNLKDNPAVDTNNEKTSTAGNKNLMKTTKEELPGIEDRRVGRQGSSKSPKQCSDDDEKDLKAQVIDDIRDTSGLKMEDTILDGMLKNDDNLDNYNFQQNQESPEISKHAAATTVQSNYRGYRVRRDLGNCSLRTSGEESGTFDMGQNEKQLKDAPAGINEHIKDILLQHVDNEGADEILPEVVSTSKMVSPSKTSYISLNENVKPLIINAVEKNDQEDPKIINGLVSNQEFAGNVTPLLAGVSSNVQKHENGEMGEHILMDQEKDTSSGKQPSTSHNSTILNEVPIGLEKTNIIEDVKTEETSSEKASAKSHDSTISNEVLKTSETIGDVKTEGSSSAEQSAKSRDSTISNEPSVDLDKSNIIEDVRTKETSSGKQSARIRHSTISHDVPVDRQESEIIEDVKTEETSSGKGSAKSHDSKSSNKDSADVKTSEMIEDVKTEETSSSKKSAKSRDSRISHEVPVDRQESEIIEDVKTEETSSGKGSAKSHDSKSSKKDSADVKTSELIEDVKTEETSSSKQSAKSRDSRISHEVPVDRQESEIIEDIKTEESSSTTGSAKSHDSTNWNDSSADVKTLETIEDVKTEETPSRKQSEESRDSTISHEVPLDREKSNIIEDVRTKEIYSGKQSAKSRGSTIAHEVPVDREESEIIDNVKTEESSSTKGSAKRHDSTILNVGSADVITSKTIEDVKTEETPSRKQSAKSRASTISNEAPVDLQELETIETANTRSEGTALGQQPTEVHDSITSAKIDDGKAKEFVLSEQITSETALTEVKDKKKGTVQEQTFEADEDSNVQITPHVIATAPPLHLLDHEYDYDISENSFHNDAATIIDPYKNAAAPPVTLLEDTEKHLTTVAKSSEQLLLSPSEKDIQSTAAEIYPPVEAIKGIAVIGHELLSSKKLDEKIQQSTTSKRESQDDPFKPPNSSEKLQYGNIEIKNVDHALTPTSHSGPAGAVPKALDVVLDQQLAIAAPNAGEKQESIESDDSEYIYIPIKEPVESSTSAEISTLGLQHSGELHDTVGMPLLNLKEEEKAQKELNLKTKAAHETESKTTDEIVSIDPTEDFSSSKSDLVGGGVSPRAQREAKGAVPKALSVILDQQLAITAPKAEDKQESSKSKGPQYIHIPLKDSTSTTETLNSVEASTSGLQHTGEFHDTISLPLLNLNQEEEPHTGLNLAVKIDHEKESETKDEAITHSVVDDFTSSKYDLVESGVSPRTRKDEEGAIPKVLGTILDQQLAITTPRAEEKREGVKSEGPEYIYIPLKSSASLQHSGELHDTIAIPLLEESRKEETLATEEPHTGKPTTSAHELSDGTATEGISDNFPDEWDNSKYDLTEGGITPRIRKEQEGAVPKVLGTVLDQQLAITAPLGKPKEDKDASVDPKYIYIPLKNGNDFSTSEDYLKNGLQVDDPNKSLTSHEKSLTNEPEEKDFGKPSQERKQTNQVQTKDSNKRSSFQEKELTNGFQGNDTISTSQEKELTKELQVKHFDKISHDEQTKVAQTVDPYMSLPSQQNDYSNASSTSKVEQLRNGHDPTNDILQNGVQSNKEMNKTITVSLFENPSLKREELQNEAAISNPPFDETLKSSSGYLTTKYKSSNLSQASSSRHRLDMAVSPTSAIEEVSVLDHKVKNLELSKVEEPSLEKSSAAKLSSAAIKHKYQVDRQTESPEFATSPTILSKEMENSPTLSLVPGQSFTNQLNDGPEANSPLLILPTSSLSLDRQDLQNVGTPSLGLHLRFSPSPAENLEGRSKSISPSSETVNISPTNDDLISAREDRSMQSESPPIVIQSTQISDNTMPFAVQLNQAPGAAVLTSPTPNDVEDDDAGGSMGAQAPGKGASAKVETPKTRAHFRTSMETGKRKNATIIKEKNMEEVAATKIQASFRGYQVRKNLKLKNGGVESVRRSLRRKSSGKLRGSEKASQKASSKPSDLEEKSATKIQAGIRGFLVRRRQQKKPKNSTAPESF